MSGNQIDRRSFLKIMGWSGAGVALSGCDLPSTVTLEEGKETVVSYVHPEEFVIPGLGVWYASTCLQCSAGCGVHGRVREGRVLKLEGNPESPINKGKLCQMGQSGLQAHYNPDRLKQPMVREGGTLKKVTWDEAWKALEDKLGGVKGDQIAWLSGSVSGHQAVLLDTYLDSVGSKNHYVYEVVNNAVTQQVNNDTLGEPMPTYRFDKAHSVLSFGADLVGASTSPVHFATQYAQFRQAPRGVLMQVEPKMSLTGGNADLWVPARPGTEGVLAMGIANVLVKTHGADASALPAALTQQIDSYDAKKVAEITGVPVEKIERIAKTLAERSPSLVLTGASAEGHEHGYQTVAAAMMLNVLLGNIGKTVVSAGDFPFPQLQARAGKTGDLAAFAEAAGKGAYQVVFISGTNPVYTAPKAMNLDGALGKVPFKVVLTHMPDETAMAADLVLPLDSAAEEWGTHVGAYQPVEKTITLQQPLMTKLYKDTRSLGDVLVALLKKQRPDDFGKYDSYFAYLQNAFAALPADYKQGMNDEQFWNTSFQHGVLKVAAAEKALSAKPAAIDNLPVYEKDSQFPFFLVPSARLGMWDGRHANLPWLQEAPDQISKVVWGSWAEIHPRTAAVLGVKNGDYVKVASQQGDVEVPVYIHRGVHPDVIAVPLGQGHDAYGRYAQGRGVNPLKILNPVHDKKTGELAMYATRVAVTKTKNQEEMVRFGGSDTQIGRKLVATVTADAFNRTEGA